jgi:tRNA (guanine37-N1)-methyltransferase
MKHRAFSVMGNIAIINFPHNTSKKEKQNFAKEILKNNKSIKTVLEKAGLFKGRLRKQQTKHLAGEKTKEALYKENNCEFRFNVDDTYFSPRLANERQEIASLIKKNEEVLVMFAGVAPFSIVIAKNSQAKKVYSNEINRKANSYAKENIKRNKLQEKIEILSGDIKKVAEKLNKKFEVIVMPRPQLKDSFLKQAFKLSKKNTRIYYYDFCKIQDKEKIIEKIKEEAKKAKRKIKITKIKHAGEIAPYKIRLRVDFKVLSWHQQQLVLDHHAK